MGATTTEIDIWCCVIGPKRYASTLLYVCLIFNFTTSISPLDLLELCFYSFEMSSDPHIDILINLYHDIQKAIKSSVVSELTCQLRSPGAPGFSRRLFWQQRRDFIYMSGNPESGEPKRNHVLIQQG
jgi:hypothetical protein